jgi:hypothetical protein
MRQEKPGIEMRQVGKKNPVVNFLRRALVEVLTGDLGSHSGR